MAWCSTYISLYGWNYQQTYNWHHYTTIATQFRWYRISWWIICIIQRIQKGFHSSHFHSINSWFRHGPATKYAKLPVAHAPGMPGTFSPPPPFRDPNMHHATSMTHVRWCMPGSLTSGFPWSRWLGKRSRHSRRMRKPQLYVSVRVGVGGGVGGWGLGLGLGVGGWGGKVWGDSHFMCFRM